MWSLEGGDGGREGLLQGGLGRFRQGRTLDVDEGDVCGHFLAEFRRECCNLFMNVHEEGIRGPSAMFLDGVSVNSIEFHGHGPPSAEGVTADKLGGETILGEPQAADGGFDLGVDVMVGDRRGGVCGSEVSAQR